MLGQRQKIFEMVADVMGEEPRARTGGSGAGILASRRAGRSNKDKNYRSTRLMNESKSTGEHSLLSKLV